MAGLFKVAQKRFVKDMIGKKVCVLYKRLSHELRGQFREGVLLKMDKNYVDIAYAGGTLSIPRENVEKVSLC